VSIDPQHLPQWLTAATGYRRNKWNDTLPLPHDQKYPPPTGHTGYDGQPVDNTHLAAWAANHHYGNLALRLPPGIIGIDVDAYGDKPGAASLTACEKKWGTLPDTWRTTSRWPDDGTSGIRLYQAPPGLEWVNPAPGIDTIHHGWRYAVAWPSVHETGRIYCWINERTYEVHADTIPITPADLPHLPDAWVNALTTGTHAPRPKGDPGDIPDEWRTPDPCDRIAAITADTHHAIANPHTIDGSRHDHLLAALLHIIGLAARGHGGIDQATSALHAQWMLHIGPARGNGPAAAEYQRMITGAVALIRGDQPQPEYCAGEHCTQGTLRPIPESLHQAITEWSEQRTQPGIDPHDGETLPQLIRRRFPILDWHALWDDTTEEEWIVEPILPARRLIALYSPPKVGKSLLMLELAAAIAEGNQVLGVTPDRPRIVLYVDFENDPKSDVRTRLRAMGYTPDTLRNLKYLSFPVLGALDSENGSIELMAAIGEYGAEVVVVDTVSRAIRGEENENDTWLNFYRHTGLKLKQAGVSLIRLDHTGKDETKGQRGGSAKGGDVDAVWRLSRVSDDVYQLTCEMNRFYINETSKKLSIERRINPILRHVVSDAALARALHARVTAALECLQSHGIDPSLGARKAREEMIRIGQTHSESSVRDAQAERRKNLGIVRETADA